MVIYIHIYRYNIYITIFTLQYYTLLTVCLSIKKSKIEIKNYIKFMRDSHLHYFEYNIVIIVDIYLLYIVYLRIKMVQISINPICGCRGDDVSVIRCKYHICITVSVASSGGMCYSNYIHNTY
eukprot:335268_1